MFLLKIPTQINIQQKNNTLIFQGSYGTNFLTLPKEVQIQLTQETLSLKILKKKNQKQFLNLYHSLIKQKIKGVLQRYKKQLFLKGLGYKIFLQKEKNILELILGFSHSIFIEIPKEIQVTLFKNTQLTVICHDLLILTKFIHSIKKLKKPEPYKGKGFFLKDEKIQLKEGKKK